MNGSIEQSHIFLTKAKKRIAKSLKRTEKMIEYEIIDDHSMNTHLPFIHSMQTT